MLSLAFALAAALSLPPGTVIAGVSTHDGTQTDVTAFFADGTSRVLFVEDHAPGILPKGSIDGEHLALALQHDGAEGATVVVRSLFDASKRNVVGERAIAKQAPRIHDDHVTWVRAAERPTRSTFDVMRAPLGAGVDEEVHASIEGAWLSPLGNDRFVHITAEGAHRVVALRGAALVVERELGKGPMRLPAIASQQGNAVIERSVGAGRAQLVAFIGQTLEHPRVLREGIAGMDPLVVENGEGNIVAGAGTKRAALTVIDSPGEAERRIDLGVAGVATPLAAAGIAGELVVVARVDRGRALPGETWIVDAKGARALVKGGAVEVYGIITNANASASTSTNGGAR